MMPRSGKAQPTLNIVNLALGLIVCFALVASAFASDTKTQAALKQSNTSESDLRIVALSPHTVELLFDLELGKYIVGTSEFANFPEAAKQIPRIANHQTINFEQLVTLAPTHLIVWQAALSPTSLNKLRTLNIPLFISNAQSFDELSKEVLELGKWFQRESAAKQLVKDFQQQLTQLRKTYANKPALSVMYVLWPKPLVVAGGNTWVSQYMEICGATNSFAHAVGSYPQINMEQVLLHDPKLIIVSEDIPKASRLNWQQWPALSAVQNHQIQLISPDEIERQTLRAANGVRSFCQLVDSARQQLSNQVAKG